MESSTTTAASGKVPAIPQSPQPPPISTAPAHNDCDHNSNRSNPAAGGDSSSVIDAYYRIALHDGVIANTVFPASLKAYLTRSEWEHLVIAFAADNIAYPQRCCCCTHCCENHGYCYRYACFDCVFDCCCDCCDVRQGCVGMLLDCCCQHNQCCQEPCLMAAMYCSTFTGCCYVAEYFESLVMRKRLKAEARYMNELLFYNEPVLRIFQNDFLTVDMKELLLVYAKKNGLANDEELHNPPASMLSMKRWVSAKKKKKNKKQNKNKKDQHRPREQDEGVDPVEVEVVSVESSPSPIERHDFTEHDITHMATTEEAEEEYYNFDEIYQQDDFGTDNQIRRGSPSRGNNAIKANRNKPAAALEQRVSFSRHLSHRIQGIFGQGPASRLPPSSGSGYSEMTVQRHLLPPPELHPQFPTYSPGLPLVLDCGSHTTKAGFATDELPRLVFPTIIGSPSNPGMIPPNDLRELYIGNDAQLYRTALNVSSPFVEDGIINNWEQMEGIWGYTFFTKLRVNPSEHPLVLSDSSSATTIATSTLDTSRLMTQREKIAQIMFETFQFPALYLACPEVLALYGAKGSLNGCVLHIGDNVMSTTCVTDGFLSSRDINMCVNGRQLTELTRSSLLYNHQYGAHIPRHNNVFVENQTAYSHFLRTVKEQIAFVALDYDMELRRPPIPTPYTLPDGTLLQLGHSNTRYYAAEALFNPARILGSFTGGSMGGNSRGTKSYIGVHGSVYNSIMQHADSNKLRLLFNNVVLSGGTTMVPGIAERLQRELRTLVPFNTNVRVITPPQRAYTVFQGGAILSSLSTFQHMWISKAEYAEFGENIVHKKCQ